MKPTNYDSFLIHLIDGLDMQEISLSNHDEAKEVAERLNQFFLKQGKRIAVELYGVIEGAPQFDSNQEFTHSLDDIHERIDL